jgi:cobalt-zinc-cadmium efflux system outer membrane protein
MTIPEKPTMALRWRGALPVLGLAAWMSAGVRAQEMDLPAAPPSALSESAAVERTLGRAAFRDLTASSVRVAEADVVAARRWTNPVLSFTFEQAKGGASGADEGIYFVQQRIEPGARRRLRTQAAEARVAGAEERVAMLRIDVEARVRRAFYGVLETQRRHEAAQDWANRLARVSEVVKLRHRAGDVSGYDLQRVAREKATVRAAVSAASADHAEAAGELGGLIGHPLDEKGPRVVGKLLAVGPRRPLEELLRKVELRPDVQALREQARAAGYDERVAKGWKIPSFTLGAGYKDVRDGGLDLDGPVAYAAVPLPVLDRQQAPARKAREQRRQARAGAEVLVQEARGRVRGTYAKEAQLSSSARIFRREALEPAEELLRTAEAAYKAGEVGVLSLLDAYRSAYEARTQYLTLARRAREAGVELDRLTGGLDR